METRTAVAISGGAHAGILVWALIAGIFNPVDDDEQLQVAAVSVISVAEFEALASAEPAPPSSPTPTAPEAPSAPTETPTPPPPVEETPPTPNPRPETPSPTVPDEAPDTTQIQPLPRAELVPEVPDAPGPLETPADDPTAEISPRPSPRPARIISALPTPVPQPDVETAPTVDTATAEQPAEEEPVEPVEEDVATAPEETAPIIVPEEAEPSRAPETSTRPGRRPNRPAPQVAEPTPDATETTTTASAAQPAPDTPIDTSAAVAAAQSGGETAPAQPPAASGPPLTQGERDGLRVAVSRCWNLGSLSTEAMRTKVTIFMQMDRDGKPRTDTIRYIRQEGGSEASARQAYEAGRRAIIRCAGEGYDLPVEKYEQWKEIEMTFNPEQMRGR